MTRVRQSIKQGWLVAAALTVLLGALGWMLLDPSPARAFPGFLDDGVMNNGFDFLDKYPFARNTRLDLDPVDPSGRNCRLCHVNPNNNPNAGKNLYGQAIQARAVGTSVFTRFGQIEGVDSDVDGWTNLAEIQARFFPGNTADEPVAGVSVSPPSDTKSEAAGSMVTFNLSVTNTSLATDTFDVTVTGQTFTTTPSPNSIGSVGAGSQAALTVSVTIPANAAAGSASVATVKVASRGNPNIFATSMLTTCTPACNPVPVLSTLTPDTAAPGAAGFVLTVDGLNFIQNMSVVRVNGQDRVTSFVNATRLTAQIPQTDIAATGNLQVTVFNSPPAGGVSNALFLSIAPTGSAIWVAVDDLDVVGFRFGAITADRTTGVAFAGGGSGSVNNCGSDDKVAGCDVFRSTDGGLTWTQVTEELSRIDIRALAANGSNVYAASRGFFGAPGGADRSRIFRSTDGGSAWQQVFDDVDPGEVNKSLAVDPLSPTTVYAGDFGSFGGGGFVVTSTQAGALGTWNHLPDIPAGEIHAYAIAIDPVTSGTLYAGGTGTPNLAKSTDGGQTWTSAAVPGVSNFVYSLAIHPTTSMALFAGTVNGVFKSTDGGTTWIQKNVGFPVPGPTINALVIDPTNPTRMHAGTSGGYFSSTDGGETWIRTNGGLTTDSARFIYGLALLPSGRLIAATSAGLFLLPEVTLTVGLPGAGSGTVTSTPAGINCPTDCTGTYTTGTPVTLTAVPAAGFTFRGFSGGNCSGTAPCTVTLVDDTTVTATFDPIPSGMVSLMAAGAGLGSGTVTSVPLGIDCGADCAEAYATGAVVTLTARADAGSIFAGWSGGGCSGTGECAVTLTANTTVTATFDPIPPGFFALSVTKMGGGTGTVTSDPGGITCGTDCTEPYQSGTVVTLTATPDPGSTFAGWSGGGCAGTGPCTLTLTTTTHVTAIFGVPGRAVITAPADGSRFPLTAPTPVTFTWTEVPGATQYFFEFTGPDLAFANPNGTAADPVKGFGGAGGGFVQPGTVFTATLTSAIPSGAYQVRVLPLGALGQPIGSFSDAVTLFLGSAAVPVTARPTITAPANGATLPRGPQVSFAWTALDGVTQYFFEFTGPGLQFANPNGRAPDTVNGFGGQGGGFVVLGTGFPAVIPPSIAAGTYRVRVIGLGALGQPLGSFSDAVTVVIP